MITWDPRFGMIIYHANMTLEVTAMRNAAPKSPGTPFEAEVPGHETPKGMP